MQPALLKLRPHPDDIAGIAKRPQAIRARLEHVHQGGLLVLGLQVLVVTCFFIRSCVSAWLLAFLTHE